MGCLIGIQIILADNGVNVEKHQNQVWVQDECLDAGTTEVGNGETVHIGGMCIMPTLFLSIVYKQTQLMISPWTGGLN